MSDPRLDVVDCVGRRVVVIDKPLFSIGRRSANDLTLTGNDVSREHAEIRQADDHYVIRDRGSRCGTIVNGAEITERPLRHGDRMRIGRTAGAELMFLIDDTPVSAAHSGGSAIIGGFRQVAALLEALRALGSSRVLDEVLLMVIDAAIDVTGAERGFIMLANHTGELEMKLARLQGSVSLAGARFETSRKIPEQVFASGQPRIVADLRDGDLAQAHDGTIALGIRHVMCVPLRLVHYVDAPGAAGEGRAIGVLYLDSREKGKLLSDTARTALETLAAEASVAIENARLYREATEKARMDEELRIASQIQQSLLPQARKNVGFCEAMGASIPCRAIGGDFFEYLDLPDAASALRWAMCQARVRRQRSSQRCCRAFRRPGIFAGGAERDTEACEPRATRAWRRLAFRHDLLLGSSLRADDSPPATPATIRRCCSRVEAFESWRPEA